MPYSTDERERQIAAAIRYLSTHPTVADTELQRRFALDPQQIEELRTLIADMR